MQGQLGVGELPSVKADGAVVQGGAFGDLGEGVGVGGGLPQPAIRVAAMDQPLRGLEADRTHCRAEACKALVNNETPSRFPCAACTVLDQLQTVLSCVLLWAFVACSSTEPLQVVYPLWDQTLAQEQLRGLRIEGAECCWNRREQSVRREVLLERGQAAGLKCRGVVTSHLLVDFGVW